MRLLGFLLCLVMAGASVAGAPIPAQSSPLGPSFVIEKANEARLADVIAYCNEHGGTIIINPEVKKGPMPVRPNHRTRIVDMRYGEGMSLIRGNHPRLEGIWPQYTGLNTGLRKNVIISDVIPHDASVESWKGEAKSVNPENKKRAQTSEEFANTHNHYQNLLSEVWSFSPTINAVALWADSGAFHPGARSWGGFLSARSWPVHWNEYVPAGTADFKDEDFDAALVGLEVDVLNGGLPHGTVSKTVGIPLSKVGVQIVGFGKRNTTALELRSEDSDDHAKKTDERRGTWHYGLIDHNSLNSESTFLITTTPEIKTGVDFSRTTFSDAAIKIRGTGSRTGVAFNNYTGGEIYAEDGKLRLRGGTSGLSILTPDGHEVIRFDEYGNVRWHGIPLVLAPFFFLLVLAAMALLAFKFARDLREARRLLQDVRKVTAGA
jgi:hypothetical protein